LKRDRAAFVLAFVVPVVFFSVFASIFRGSSSRATTRQIAVAVVDEDRSANSARFVDALKREKGLRVLDTLSLPGGRTAPIADRAGAEALVRSGDAPLALIVPRGFGSSPIRFGPSERGPTLTVLADTSDPIAPQVFFGLLQKVAMTSMPDVMAETGIEEVESGTLDRILSTRVTMTQLLLGKLLYLATVAVAQLTVMFLWGELFFGLELHSHVPGFLVMAVVTALAASAFGLVLAALSR